MAQHKSAEKRNRQNAIRSARNTAIRSRMKKAIKDARQALADKADNRAELVAQAIREVQRAGSKHVLQSNTVSRYVSRLSKAAHRAA